ncbi:uncharacterized protein [Hetaerina americana]|uniref:uncharacterized protein n=1 Tax=Hetaerina americana TaxID=62018 RepID=UPI003A7F3E57
MVERFHRQLKGAIRCHGTEDWMDVLPAILLGVCSAWKEDICATPVELLYGEPLKLPGEFLSPSRQPVGADLTQFPDRLGEHFRRISPKPASHHGARKVFVFKDLPSSSHVFVRHDGVKPPLRLPYNGPYPVVRSGLKYFVLRIKGREVKVSIDQLKPAHILDPDDLPLQGDAGPEETAARSNMPPPEDVGPAETAAGNNMPSAEHEKTTRSGRRVHFPKRLRQYIT